MTTHTTTPARRALRAAALLTPAALTLLAATPALANTPEGWSNPEPVSGLDRLLVWVVYPLVVIGVVVLLASLPRLVHSAQRAPGVTEPAPAYDDESALDELLGAPTPAELDTPGEGGSATH
ncbi:MAG TPA: hypothetical protein PLP61_01770 [Nocardioides sp.]|uniref:hypothetical protein n=1 Tax=Nocardioides sp. TaxID=35761 RepID=UPI002C2EC97E|nr:hypothetical protein [Nocardioides sp.]HQR25741.1 hypothetical protein [Nocardioides sp.]